MTIELLILQATSFCNIDCSYCYLPGRTEKGRMSDAVIAAACDRASDAKLVGERISIVWHAGEPLALPVAYYENAIGIVAQHLPKDTAIEHHFQTNATLIDDNWCRLFARPDVRVGVSVDGPRALHDRFRRTRSGSGSFERTIRGVDRLRRAGVPFHVITVLSRDSLHFPDEIYDFYVRHGIENVCFNIEEIEGTNARSSLSDRRCETLYKRFFARFIERSSTGREIKSVRELDQTFGLVLSRADRTAMHNQQADPFAILTVAKNGDFSTFSPELLGMVDSRWQNFVFGNVLQDDIRETVRSEKFRRVNDEIRQGLDSCRNSCAYFDLCGGGAPSNKLYETGRFDATETLYCRYTIKMLAEVVLDSIECQAAIAEPQVQL